MTELDKNSQFDIRSFVQTDVCSPEVSTDGANDY